VHRIAEIGQNLLGAALAGIFLIRVASLASNQFPVFERHAPAAKPVLPVANMDMIELDHAAILRGYSVLGCG
jgi:hypothetical protein